MTLYADVFRALEAANVRYVIVGGVAVVLSGHVRATVDLDVVIDLEPEPALLAMEALLALGLEPRVPVDARDLAVPGIRAEWIQTKNMQVFSLYDPERVAREVDVFVAYPVEFEALYADAVRMDVDGVVVRVASRAHLVAMKRAAGRPQDLADVQALEELRERDADG